jgi:hypothetical protein
VDFIFDRCPDHTLESGTGKPVIVLVLLGSIF